jgi:hypothetical protein
VPQHQDPLVYNSFTGDWQNASKAGPSGVPIGMSIGDPAGSQVSLQPAIGQTVQLDSGGLYTLLSAVQTSSGSVVETAPAYSCAIIASQGAANEKLGHLTVSGLAAGTAQAVVLTSDSADGTSHGFIRHGTITPGAPGGATYNFTSALTTTPNSQRMQAGAGYRFVATNPVTGGTAAETWHQLSGLSNGWALGPGFWAYRMTVQGELQMVAQRLSPGTSADGTQVLSGAKIPGAYNLPSSHRFPIYTDNIRNPAGQNNPQSPGFLLDTDGHVECYGVGANATRVDFSVTIPLDI